MNFWVAAGVSVVFSPAAIWRRKMSMEPNTQLPTEQAPPPERFPLMRKYARAIASESRRFYYGLTRDNVTSFLKTMAWAVPLTVLIWVYAESEQQVTDAGQPISIEVKSRDPNKIVTLDRGVRSITCDLTGPRSNLDRFKETLSTSTPIVIELDTRQIGDGYIPTLDNLRENPQFRDAGVTVLKCDPASLPVYVDTLEKRSLPVKLPSDVSGSRAVFDPPTVTVTGPSRFVKSFNEVTADISALPELNTPGVHPPVNVSLQPDPSGYLTYEPSQVKAVLTVAQTDVTRTFTVPIWLAMQPDINKQYDVTLNGNGFVLKLDLIGPPEQLARIGKDVNPHFLLNIDHANVSSTGPVPLQIEGLPDGVRLADSPPETTFTATPRQ
jgi:hypothetical protein